MFNSMKKTYTRKTVSITTNGYGEDIETYTAASDVLMFISLSNEEINNSNDMRIRECSHIGLTSSSISVGDIIADKYEVQFINAVEVEKIVFMKEIDNDGYFN